MQMKKCRLYVASSHRNPYFRGVMTALAAAGYRFYDWEKEHADAGYTNKQADGRAVLSIDPVHRRLCALACFRAISQSDGFILVLPAGAASHIELGYYISLWRAARPIVESSLTTPIILALGEADLQENLYSVATVVTSMESLRLLLDLYEAYCNARPWTHEEPGIEE